MRDEIEDIAKALKQARQANGMSQRALGERVGLPQTHISKIEKGATNIRLATLIELARALDLEVELIPRELTGLLQAVRNKSRPELSEPSRPMYGLDDGPEQ
jgi:HTH-type transcriptional regulator / antitoxin HipB